MTKLIKKTLSESALSRDTGNHKIKIKVSEVKTIYGQFYIQTDLINSESLYMNEILSIYDSKLTLSDDEYDKRIMFVGDNAKDITIKFKNAYLDSSMIKTIKLGEDTEDLEFTIKDKTLSISSDIPLIEEIAKTITITDFTNNVVTLSLYVLNKENPFSISQEIMSISENKEFNAVFAFAMDSSLFTKADLNSTYSLTLTKSTSETLPITYKAPSSFDSFSTGTYCVKLYYYKDTQFIQNCNLFIYNKDLLPTKADDINIAPTSPSLIISFDKPFYYKYLDGFTTTKIDADTYLSSEYSVKNEKLIFGIKEEITDTFTLTLTLIDASTISLTIHQITCTAPEIPNDNNGNVQCLLCSQIDSSTPFYSSDSNICLSSCPKSQFSYNNTCLPSCPDTLLIFSTQCVDTCPSGLGTFTTPRTCVDCSELGLIAIDGVCEKNCTHGTTLNSNNECVLPETLPTEDKCTDYCAHGNCTVVKGNPECVCFEGWDGLLCDANLNDSTTNINETITNTLDSLFTPDTDDEGKEKEYVDIKLTSVKVIVEIKQIAFGIHKKNMTIPEEKRDVIISTTKNTMKNILANKEKKTDNVIHLIGLGLSVLIQKLQLRKLRNLQETNEAIDTINEIISDANEINKNIASTDSTFSFDDALMKSDTGRYITYQRWTNSAKSRKLNELNSIDNNLTVVDMRPYIALKFPAASSDAEYLYVITDLSREFRELISASGFRRLASSVSSNKINLSLYQKLNGNYNEVSIENEGTIIVKYPVRSYEQINFELFKYYKEKGIDIYNPKDKAFTDRCYYNDKLDYDLPQKYRMNNMYQQYTFNPNNESDCVYQELELTTGLISFMCDISKTNGQDIEFVFSSSPSAKTNHVDNLPTKCGGDIDSLANNIGFWLFLVLFVVFIVGDILFAVLSTKRMMGDRTSTSIKNDDIMNAKHFEKVCTTDNAHTEGDVDPKEITVDVSNNFSSIFISNLKYLHPLLSICRTSILSPIMLNSWVFLYNIINLFGFNALYFNETMIEDRIYDKHRDNFGYPMKTEFEKIMSAIATSIVLTIIVLAINLVTIDSKNKLSSDIMSAKSNEEKERVISEFSSGMFVRRIISGVFMLALNVFFFYYVVVFCGIYVNTQYGWFYSGLWALFFNWVIYAPIYVLIISLVEMKGGNNCVYYMKQLFVF